MSAVKGKRKEIDNSDGINEINHSEGLTPRALHFKPYEPDL
jgi:hypothetical protein